MKKSIFALLLIFLILPGPFVHITQAEELESDSHIRTDTDTTEEDTFVFPQWTPEVIETVPLTPDEYGIPSVPYQVGSNMDRTSQVPFPPPDEKPVMLWNMFFEIVLPRPAIFVDDEGYTWFSGEEKLGDMPHNYRLAPDGTVDWSIPVAMPYNVLEMLIIDSWPYNFSFPVVTLNEAVVYFTNHIIVEDRTIDYVYFFEAIDKSGQTRWRTETFDDWSGNFDGFRISGDRLVYTDIYESQWMTFSLVDGSLLETLTVDGWNTIMNNALGPHEMPDGSYIGFFTGFIDESNGLTRFNVPGPEIIWQVSRDNDNKFNPGPAFVIDNQHVVAGKRYSLVCHDAATGDVSWEIHGDGGFWPRGVTPEGLVVVFVNSPDNPQHVMLVDSEGNVVTDTECISKAPITEINIYNDGSILYPTGKSIVLLNPDLSLAWELTSEEIGLPDDDTRALGWDLRPTVDGRIVVGFPESGFGFGGYVVCIGPEDFEW